MALEKYPVLPVLKRNGVVYLSGSNLSSEFACYNLCSANTHNMELTTTQSRYHYFHSDEIVHATGWYGVNNTSEESGDKSRMKRHDNRGATS